MSEFNNFWWTAVLQCIPFAMRWKSDWTRKTNRFISNTTPFKLINICRKNAVGLRPLCFVLIVSTVSNLFQVKHVVCGIRWIFDSLTPEINRSLQVKLSIQLNGSAVHLGTPNTAIFIRLIVVYITILRKCTISEGITYLVSHIHVLSEAIDCQLIRIVFIRFGVKAICIAGIHFGEFSFG